jgi:putative aldouronate transport system permease protein
MKRTREDIVIDSINYVLLLLGFAVTVYPFYYILIQSLNDPQDAMLGGIYLFPRKFTFDNYSNFFSDMKWVNALGISVARTVLGTLLGVFSQACSLMLYPLNH